jgi:hypothetical protein
MKLFKGNLKGLDLQELQQGMGKLEGFNFNLLPKGLNPEINKGLNFKGDIRSRVKMLDQHGSITLETTKDGKVVELLDKEGKLHYRGPYNNKADKMNVPEDLRERVENLDIDNGIGLKAAPDLGNHNARDLKLRALEQLLEMQEMNKRLKPLLDIPNPLLKDVEKLFNQKVNGVTMSTKRTDPSTGNRYTYKLVDKEKQVEVYDPNGELLFNGPYNSEADKASVPEEHRDFLQQLEADLPDIGK